MLLVVEMERKGWIHEEIFRIWRLMVRRGEKEEGSKMTPRLLVNISCSVIYLVYIERRPGLGRKVMEIKKLRQCQG